MATPTITIKFDLDSTSSSFKKFVLTDTTNWPSLGYAAADVKGYFKLTYPDGTTRTGNFTTPDTNGATPDFVFDTLAIPNTTAGGYLLGGYTFQYYAQVDDGVNPVVNLNTAVQSYSFCPDKVIDTTTGKIKSVDLQHEIDCVCNLVTLTDKQDYGTFTTLTRLLTLHPPSIAAEADKTSTGKTLVYQFTWVNAAYEFYADNLVTYVSSNVTVSIRMSANVPKIINCDYDLCALTNCILSFINTQVLAIQNNNALTPTQVANGQWLLLQWQALNNALTCGQNKKVETLYDDIKAWLAIAVPGCDCGCDGEDGVPKKVDPYCAGSASVTVYTFQATYPVTVTVDGSVVTYALDADWVATVTALYLTVLTSLDSSVALTDTGNVGGTRTFDLSVLQTLAFTLQIDYAGSVPLDFTVTNAVTRGNKYNNDPAVWTVDTKQAYATLSDLEALPAVFKISGFRTTTLLSGTLPDKVQITSTEIKYLSDPSPGVAGEFEYQKLVDLEVVGKDADNIYFRLVYHILGTVVSMDEFVANIDYIKMDFLISE